MAITRIVQQAGNCICIGLSTDTKPSPISGHAFVEEDTGKFFLGNGSSWVQMSQDMIFGTPTSRTLSLATAYQATTPAKSALITINITSSATLSLSGGTTNSADIVIGSTNAVASGTGTTISKYSNSNTGTLTIGLNTQAVSAVPCHFVLPPNWYFAIRQTAGAISITSAFDQALG